MGVAAATRRRRLQSGCSKRPPLLPSRTPDCGLHTHAGPRALHTMIMRKPVVKGSHERHPRSLSEGTSLRRRKTLDCKAGEGEEERKSLKPISITGGEHVSFMSVNPSRRNEGKVRKPLMLLLQSLRPSLISSGAAPVQLCTRCHTPTPSAHPLARLLQENRLTYTDFQCTFASVVDCGYLICSNRHYHNRSYHLQRNASHTRRNKKASDR